MFVRIPRRPGKSRDTRRCAYLPRWCASSGKEKSGFPFHFDEIIITVGFSGGGFFSASFRPSSRCLPPFSSRAVLIIVLPALRRGAALTTPALCRSPDSSLHLLLFSLSHRHASRASGGRLCTTFRPRQRWSHTSLYRQYIPSTGHCQLSETTFSSHN